MTLSLFDSNISPLALTGTPVKEPNLHHAQQLSLAAHLASPPAAATHPPITQQLTQPSAPQGAFGVCCPTGCSHAPANYTTAHTAFSSTRGLRVLLSALSTHVSLEFLYFLPESRK